MRLLFLLLLLANLAVFAMLQWGGSMTARNPHPALHPERIALVGEPRAIPSPRPPPVHAPLPAPQPAPSIRLKTRHQRQTLHDLGTGSAGAAGQRRRRAGSTQAG